MTAKNGNRYELGTNASLFADLENPKTPTEVWAMILWVKEEKDFFTKTGLFSLKSFSFMVLCPFWLHGGRWDHALSVRSKRIFDNCHCFSATTLQS